VIPREGVESLYDEYLILSLNRAVPLVVIPREGVESLYDETYLT